MDMNAYLSMFIDESNDHLQALNENLLKLEGEPGELSIVQAIFRSAHTLKGMSATMGFEDLAALTHEMENVLDLVRNSKLKMDSFIFDTLFKGLDALEAMVQDIVGGGTGKADVTAIVASLQVILKSDYKSGAASAQPVATEAAKPSAGTAGAMLLDESVFTISPLEGADLQKQISDISEIESAVVTLLDQESLAMLSQSPAAPAIDSAAQGNETAAAPVIEAQSQTAAATAAAPAAQSSASSAPAPAVSRTIRVDIERLDTLMNLFSELLIDRVRLEQLSSEIKRNDLTETVEHMARVSSDLQNIVLKLRMVPVESVFNRFPRMIRDLAKSLDKKIDLVISGAETELDRTVIDEIGDPLVHLLRNSVDHGIETVEERIAAGKSETGTINLRAYHSGNHVFIEVEEDGRGIHKDKVLKTAIKNGVVTEEEAKKLTNDEINMLIFAAGFSTADKISDISGRGVGLDVVRSKITSLGGNVTVDSAPGRGTKFSVQLPLTLSIISAMLVKLGSEKYAIPLTSIVETGIIRKEQVLHVHGNRMIEFRNTIIPVVSLSKVLDSPDYNEDTEDETEIVVVRKGEKWAAVTVDEFIGQSEIVLKTLG
ncbi:chemotaxis protein CheA, partial [Paenibacillus sp. MCAF20]